ncbi:MAG: hypothetical protein HN855_10345 [Anaerolineae bacterium]|jgi:hypothetical protein|nr:hypothetical protein [Anaerolineae bacterium]MBT7072156.1 hypothetical protein [Anaerolineae bacterium]MBT7325551.1 hypothetical protein [Anaerolineae bacterium]
MRIIDKTPFLEEDGSISFINRIQGTLQNGFSWYGNLQLQQKVLASFEKRLDKKFTIIRNHTLGASKITVPFILIGPPGVYIFLITNIEGAYRAKADGWGTIEGERFKEASINLLKRTTQLAKAVQVYLKRQNIELPKEIEPVLLALNPGIHIDSVRPSVRIVMRDAVERFASSISQLPPIMAVADVHQISEVIINPLRAKAKPSAPQAEIPQEEEPFASESVSPPPANDFGDLGFSFEDEDEPVESLPPIESAPAPVKRKAPPTTKTGDILMGLTKKQLTILALMGVVLACILVIFTFAALLFL